MQRTPRTRRPPRGALGKASTCSFGPTVREAAAGDQGTACLRPPPKDRALETAQTKVCVSRRPVRRFGEDARCIPRKGDGDAWRMLWPLFRATTWGAGQVPSPMRRRSDCPDSSHKSAAEFSCYGIGHSSLILLAQVQEGLRIGSHF